MTRRTARAALTAAAVLTGAAVLGAVAVAALPGAGTAGAGTASQPADLVVRPAAVPAAGTGWPAGVRRVEDRTLADLTELGRGVR